VIGDRMFKRIEWPTASVLIAGLLVLGTTLLAGPSLGLDVPQLLQTLAGEGGALALVTAAMRGLFKPGTSK
jgi:hypothetical protein